MSLGRFLELMGRLRCFSLSLSPLMSFRYSFKSSSAVMLARWSIPHAARAARHPASPTCAHTHALPLPCHKNGYGSGSHGGWNGSTRTNCNGSIRAPLAPAANATQGPKKACNW